MELVWADQCAGDAGALPDPELWGLRETDRWQPADELQRYTRNPANARYDGLGHLVITAISEGTGRYTSARLSARHSRKPALFRYGRFEARIRIPTGAGIWPAWWLLGQDDRFGWPHCGEVDIMEAPASASAIGQIHQGTHSPSSDGTGAVGVGVRPSTGDWGHDFHTYSVTWLPGRVEFAIDRSITGAVSRSEVEARKGIWVLDDRPQSPVLNVAVGGWAGAPDGTWTEQSMLVEWVRVYA